MKRRNFFRNLLILPFAGVVVNLALHSYQENVPPPIKVYKSVYEDSTSLVGYRGSQFWECGYVYFPYIPLYTTANAGVVAVPSKH